MSACPEKLNPDGAIYGMMVGEILCCFKNAAISAFGMIVCTALRLAEGCRARFSTYTGALISWFG